MAGELTREAPAEIVAVREDAGTGQRFLDIDVLPFGVTAMVPPDREGGRPYRERIVPGATAGLDPESVTLEAHRHGGPLVGRGVAAEANGQRLRMTMLVSRTRDGDELYELARDGVYRAASAVFTADSAGTRRGTDGVTERHRITVRRVAVLERGAYPGAAVVAVRSREDGTMTDQATPATDAEDTEDTAEDTTAAPEGARPNRTRVTVDVERATAERDTVAEMRRGAAGPAAGGRMELARSSFGLPGIYVTRDQLVYGPRSGHSWLRDLVGAHTGNSEAAERYARHGRMLDDVGSQMVELGRAGDFLSSEAGGAYPNVYLPGLLTPRILKGRPMGSFYDNYPVNNAAPQVFPKVTTSATVAVQSAEGAALSATDVATTAVTTTPSMYGAYIDVSRQVIDGGSPAADQILYQDLIESYAQVSEAAIKTAVEAGSSASGTAITAATPYAGTIGNVIAYYAARFKPAQGQFVPAALFSTLLNQLGTDGRPLMPYLNPNNTDGAVQVGGSSGEILGSATILSYASTTNVVVTARRDDFVVFESPVVRFSYDQVAGPHAVRIGIWAYLGIGARLGSLKVTAA